MAMSRIKIIVFDWFICGILCDRRGKERFELLNNVSFITQNRCPCCNDATCLLVVSYQPMTMTCICLSLLNMYSDEVL